MKAIKYFNKNYIKEFVSGGVTKNNYLFNQKNFSNLGSDKYHKPLTSNSLAHYSSNAGDNGQQGNNKQDNENNNKKISLKEIVYTTVITSIINTLIVYVFNYNKERKKHKEEEIKKHNEKIDDMNKKFTSAIEKGFSSNWIKDEEKKNNQAIMDDIKKEVDYFIENYKSIDLKNGEFTNVLYILNAASAYNTYRHDGSNARKTLKCADELVKNYIQKDQELEIDFEVLNETQWHTLLSKIPDLPILYTRIMYSLGRTYIYEGDPKDGKKYFKLSKDLGKELKIFESVLSIRGGIGIITEKIITKHISDNNREQAIKEIKDIIKLYKDLKIDSTEYKEGYKPGDSNSNSKCKTIVPKNDVYNRIECGEQIIKYYGKLLILNNDKNEQKKYLTEISNQLEGRDGLLLDLTSKLKEYEIPSKKIASVSNNLGYMLLNVYINNVKTTSKVDTKKLETVIAKSLNIKASNTLEMVKNLFDLANNKSTDNDFTKVDSYNGIAKTKYMMSKQNLSSEEKDKFIEEAKQYIEKCITLSNYLRLPTADRCDAQKLMGNNSSEDNNSSE